MEAYRGSNGDYHIDMDNESDFQWPYYDSPHSSYPLSPRIQEWGYSYVRSSYSANVDESFAIEPSIMLESLSSMPTPPMDTLGIDEAYDKHEYHRFCGKDRESEDDHRCFEDCLVMGQVMDTIPTPEITLARAVERGELSRQYIIDRRPRSRRYNTRVACVQCSRQKVACDQERPCKRCVRNGRGDKCCDRQHILKRARLDSPATSPKMVPKRQSFSDDSLASPSNRMQQNHLFVMSVDMTINLTHAPICRPLQRNES